MVQRQYKTQLMYVGQTSAYLTAGTASTVLPKVQRFTPLREWVKVYERGLGEGGQYPTKAHLSQYKCGGSITVNLTQDGCDFLKYWVGPKTGAGSSADPYVLTESTDVTLSTSGIQVFTLSEANATTGDVVDNTFVGCVGTTYELSGSIGGMLTARLDFVSGTNITDTSAPSYTESTEIGFVMVNGVWKWGQTPSTVTGIQSFTITHTNDIDPSLHYSIDSPFIDQPTVGQKLYTFTLSLKMSQTIATNFVDVFYAATGAPEDGSTTTLSPANNELQIQLINDSRTLELYLDQCHIDRIRDIKALGNGIVILEVEGTALYGKDNKPIRWWTV